MSNLLNTGEIPLVDAKTAAQERAANVFQPKVSREEHAVIRDQLDDLIEKYGAIPKGYKPQRDVAIPKSTDGETFVRNFVRTAIEAKGVTDAGVELLERGVLQDQMLSRSVQTDKAAIANADRTIRKLGFQRALNEWRGRADGERAMTKNDVVLGECLMIAANKAGDLETGYQLAAELAEAGTNAGQVTQAFSILKKAPPAWQLYYINRVVNRMNTKYAKRINSGKMTQIVINRDLAKAVLPRQDAGGYYDRYGRPAGRHRHPDSRYLHGQVERLEIPGYAWEPENAYPQHRRQCDLHSCQVRKGHDSRGS